MFGLPGIRSTLVQTNSEITGDPLPYVIHFEGKQARQERRAQTLIKRNRQRELNRAEWRRRAREAASRGDHEVASNILHFLNQGYD